ncbi:lipase [Pseudomassariella vexata]|uniref:Lipase n=1 Tax=Pseudomassariella vexata TaxID=1141098 RepID=A0A1Y2DIF5_9PEZI|nr:lipase [Pseudomassariella vexata]ORY58585.1 lipase [Pseudomassariella vexata]
MGDNSVVASSEAFFQITEATLNDFAFYAQYAGAAYCNADTAVGDVVTCTNDVCSDVTAANATVVATYQGKLTDVEVYVASDPTNELVVVSFMGTQSIRQWIVDLSFVFSPIFDLVASGYVHTGFHAQFTESKSAVLAAVTAAMAVNPSYKIIVTGHSLGASVGTIMAAYLREQGFPCDLWTYGSPRVGDDDFADFVTAQAGAEYRATHTDDPVPRLPPIWTGYRHTSPEYWFYTGDATTLDYTINDVQVCSGNANVDCNAGQSGFDTIAHDEYFVGIADCAPDGLTFKRATNVNVTDEELERLLTTWAAMDVKYVQSGNATTQGGNVTTTS